MDIIYTKTEICNSTRIQFLLPVSLTIEYKINIALSNFMLLH